MVENTTTTGTAKLTFPSDSETLFVRDFAAPPRLVYKAWTTPELVMRYWAGHHGTMKSADIDLRVGGAWRYVMESGGQEHAFSGEFREIVENERIVNTEIYEAVAVPEPAVNVVTFTPLENGGTRLELLTTYDSPQTRDAVVASGMEAGAQEQFDVLDELALSLD